MLDSLLSAIDAASKVVNVPREPGESNTAYAQRVAAAIRSLPPQQLAAAQQHIDAQMRTPVSLPLLAAALEDPESPQTVQLALSLEQASAAEPDAVLKAVVNSYGQNAGEVERPVAQALVSAPLQKVADLTALATGLAAAAEEPASAMPTPAPATTAPATAQPAAQPAPAAHPTPQSGIPVQSQSAPAAAQAIQASPAQAQTVAQNGTVAPQAAPAGNGAAGTAAATVQSSTLASLVDDLTASVLLTAIAAEAELPTEVALIRSPLAPPPMPRDIQQIEADIKQGLQVVIGAPAMATDPDLLQIINNPSSSAEKIIAQALTGNAAAQAASGQPAVDENTRSPASVAAAPVSLTEQPEAPAAVLSSGKPSLQAPPATAAAVYEAAEQTAMPAPQPLGVPFVVANYLPVDTPGRSSEMMKLSNRVDPAGDEEGRQAQDEETASDQDENEAHPEEPSARAAEETSDEAEAGSAPEQGAAIAPEHVALPQPLRDPLQDHAFDFYRRMVAWE